MLIPCLSDPQTVVLTALVSALSPLLMLRVAADSSPNPIGTKKSVSGNSEIQICSAAFPHWCTCGKYGPALRRYDRSKACRHKCSPWNGACCTSCKTNENPKKILQKS
ncbi:hypothetical protein Dimus_038731 [Dionaea muscipula]